MVFANNDIIWIYLAAAVCIVTVIFCYLLYKKRKKISEIILFILSMLCLIIWLFSPRLENFHFQVSSQSWNILFILDVSTSMQVWDIQKSWALISRLQASKDIIINFIDSHTQHNYWLYWFSWEALELLPFTQDINLFKTILSGVDENNISVKWSDFTNLFENIDSYISQIDDPTTFVIFSDAGDIQQLQIPKKTLDALEKKSIEIVFVATGTKKWWKILDWVDFYGRPTYKMYDGKTVISQLDYKQVVDISKKYWWESVEFNNYKAIDKIHKTIEKKLLTSQTLRNISQAQDITFVFIWLFMLFFSIFLFLEKRRF